MAVAERISAKLNDALTPLRLEVIDESDRHIGHAGHDGRGESHFRVVIVSDRFSGLGQLARHRLVNEILAEELSVGRVHALSMETRAPGESSPGAEGKA